MRTGRFLLNLFTNPIQSIRILPQTSAIKTLLIQLFILVISSIGHTLINSSSQDITSQASEALYSILFGFSSMCLLSTFLHYFLLLFQNLNIQLVEIHRLTVFSHIPLLITYILSPWLAPIILIGYAITCTLLAVGLVENFEINKKLSIRLSLFLFILFTACWATISATL